MKSLIIYASKAGTTQKCAEFIRENNQNADIYDVKKIKTHLKEYNHIVLLSPVYMGQLNKSIKKILKNSKVELLSKPLTIIICSMNESETDNVITNNIDNELKAHADIYKVGGGYNFEKLGFLSKFIIKKMAGVTESVDNINYELLKTIAI